jgi:hypothetical protein
MIFILSFQKNYKNNRIEKKTNIKIKNKTDAIKYMFALAKQKKIDEIHCQDSVFFIFNIQNDSIIDITNIHRDSCNKSLISEFDGGGQTVEINTFTGKIIRYYRGK